MIKSQGLNIFIIFTHSAYRRVW